MSRKDKKKKQPPHDRKKDDKKEGKENKQKGKSKWKFIVTVPKKVVTHPQIKPTPDRMKQPSIMSAFQPRKRCSSPTVVTISDDEEEPVKEETAVDPVTAKDSHDSQQPHCSYSGPQIMTSPSSLVIKLPSDPTRHDMNGPKMSVQRFQSAMEDLKAEFPLQWNVKLQRNTLHDAFQNLFSYATGSPLIPLTHYGLRKMLKWTQEWRKRNETAGHGDREYRSLLTSYLLQKKKRHTRHFRVVGQDEEDDDAVSHVSDTQPNSPEIYEKMVMPKGQERWAANDDLETPGSSSMMRDLIPKVMQIQPDFVSELQPILTECRNEKRQILNASDKKEIRATGITLDLKTVDDLKLLLFHSGEWDHEPGYDNQSFQLPTQYLRPTKYGLTNLPTYLLMCSYENETWSTVEAIALGEICSSSVAVRFGLSEESLRRSHPAHLGFYWMKAKSCNTDGSYQSVVTPTNDMTASSSLDAAYSVVRPANDVGHGVDSEPTDNVDDHESEPLIDPFEYFYNQNNDEDEEVIADDPYSDGGEESDEDMGQVTNGEKVNKEEDKPAQSPEKVAELCAKHTASLHPKAMIWGESPAQFKKRLEIVYASDPKYGKRRGFNQSMTTFISENLPRSRSPALYLTTNRFTEPVFSENVDEVVKNEIVKAGSPLMPATNYDVALIGAWTFNWINKAGSYVSRCNGYNGYNGYILCVTRKTGKIHMEKTHWCDGTRIRDIGPRGGRNRPVLETDVQIWQGEISSEPQPKNENFQTPIKPIHQTSSNKSIPGTRFHTKWLTSPVTSNLSHNRNGSSQFRPDTVHAGAIKQLKAILQYTGSECEFKNSPILKKFMNSDKTVSFLDNNGKQVTVTGKQGYIRIRDTDRSIRICTDMTCWLGSDGGGKCFKHSESIKCVLIHDVNNRSIKVFAVVLEYHKRKYANEDERISRIVTRCITYRGSFANYICNREGMGFIPEWRIVCESEELSHKEFEKFRNEKMTILDTFFAHHNSKCELDKKMTLLNSRVSTEDIDLEAVKHGLDEMGLKFTEGGESDLGLVNWHPATRRGYQVQERDRLVYIRFGLPGQLYGGRHSVNFYCTGSKRYMARHHSDCYKDLPVHRSLSKNITNATREMQRREGALQMCILICEMNGSRIDGIPIQRDFKMLECSDLWTKEDAVWFGEMHQFLTGRDINAEFTKPVDINNFKW